MATSVRFNVKDNSPTIFYSPFRDTLSSPRLSEGWNPYFSESGFASAPGVKGNGTGTHITSKDGASFTISWKGTGIQLQGQVVNATYAINLDGQDVNNLGEATSSEVLATITNLDDKDHVLTLTARIPNADPASASTVAFQQALIVSVPPNVNSTLGRLVFLEDSTVAFHGRWGFGTEDNVTFHQSNSVGDRATATFRGAAFALQGTTSPNAGNYSVTVNNQTVFYSARSSFLAHDTLLHFSTGLDPNATHTVTVKNEGGGTLSLLEGGFGVYTTGSPIPPSPSPEPVAATSFPKGTIAAFVLAGILAFMFFSGFLYFWFIYRPRKKYQLERERWRGSWQFRTGKATEAGDVLDIGPTGPAPERDLTFTFISERTPSPPSQARAPHRESGKSSFARWKHEVENAVARDSLGIQFRHSSLYDEKHELPRDAGTVQTTSDAISSRSSPSVFRNAMFMMGIGRHSRTSSGNSKRNGRNKGKEAKRVSDNRSWSPGYHINIPFQPPSQEERVPTRTQTSLSYMTAPLGFETEAREPAPPSYAASVSHRESESPPSVPHSVTHSSSIPTISQPQNKGKARASSEDRLRDQPASPVTSYTSSLTPPYPVRDLSKEDRGSVMDQSIDETPAVLSGPAVRRLIRSLSPRTSKASFPQQRNPLSLELASLSLQPSTPSPQQPESPQQPQRTPRPLPKPPTAAPLPSPTRSETQEGPGTQSEPVSPSTEEHGAPAVSGPVRCSGTFGPRPTSFGTGAQESTGLPPQIPFPSLSTSTSPSASQQATQWSSTPASSSHRLSGRFSNRMSRLVPRTEVIQGQPFRLTPTSLTPLQPLPEHQDPAARHSFLDMTSSSDVSAHSRENTDSSSLRGDTRQYSTPPQGLLSLPEERSRWSSSTSAPISLDLPENDDGKEPRDDNDTSNPKPQIAFSPPSELIIPSAAQFLLPQRDQNRVSISETSTRSDPVHVHPILEPLESPTDSLPFTTSDVDFLHGSDSEELPAITRGRLTLEGQSVRTSASSMYVPAMPTPPEPHLEGEAVVPSPTPPPALSSPNYLVQRVLGLHSPTSSVTFRPGHSRGGSSSAFTTPFGTVRFEGSSSHPRRDNTTDDTDDATDVSRTRSPKNFS